MPRYRSLGSLSPPVGVVVEAPEVLGPIASRIGEASERLRSLASRIGEASERLGALASLAHPLTVVVAFCAAPLTSLTPVIGAGYVAAFAQTLLAPPRVGELVSAVDDAAHLRRWWENRLLRILVVFVLTTLGSVIGTFVGGAEILSRLF